MSHTAHITKFAGWRCCFASRGNRRLGLPTRREVELVAGLASGWSQKEIAKARGVTPNTIRSTADAAYFRLDARCATEAVAKALRRGWISPIALALIIAAGAHHQPAYRVRQPAPPAVRIARQEVAA